MIKIDIGKDRYGNTVSMNETLGYGVVMVIAQPRYGKSVLVKNIYTQIAQHRHLIVLDYQGEHNDAKWGNWSSKDKICFIPDLKEIKNFGFYISDFDQFDDWTSMGFSQKSAPLLMRIIKNVNTHQNSPQLLLDILSHLPTSSDDLDDFNENYENVNIHEPTNYAIKQSIIYTMRTIIDTGLIIAEEGTDEHEELTPNKIHIEDWAELVRYNQHLNINLNMFSSGSVGIARASVGKILEKLLPVLGELKPLIIAEEAAKICPNTGERDNEQITSQLQLRDYVVRHQRTGVKLMFITQDPNLLDQDTLGAGMTWIMGIHKPNAVTKSILDTYNLNYEKDVISKLRHDNDKGLRDFVIMEVGNGGKYTVFTPFDSSSRLPKRYNTHSIYRKEQQLGDGNGILRKHMFNY